MAPTIGLAMIVRNEATVIGRCLASVRPLIDAWTIVDTGSDDDTVARIEIALDGVPGTLIEEPWVDFGQNRTSLMRHARGTADYLLLVDADMTVLAIGDLPDLDADAYRLRHTGDLSYAIPRLVRSELDWRYEGATHEYLTSDTIHTSADLEPWVIEHHADGGSRSDKFDRDRRLLEQGLAAAPDDPRTLFYLAQTYRDLGETALAVETYRRRVTVGGWDEETFYAQYQLGLLLVPGDWAAGSAALLTAWEMRPTRAEPLLELARGYRNRGDHHLAELFAQRGCEIPLPADLLFVHREAYDWALRFEHAIALYWTGDLVTARRLNAELLTTGLPADIEPWVRHNLAWCNKALDERALVEPAWSARGLPPLTELVPGATLSEVRLALDDGWSAMNPSITNGPDGLHMLLRTVNYELDDWGRYTIHDDSDVIRTRNRLLTLDDTLAVRTEMTLCEVPEGPDVHRSRVSGCEDGRLIEVGGQWLATATVRDRNDAERCEIALLRIGERDVEAVDLLDAGTRGRHEKNWMPFVRDGDLHLVYSCDPLIVLRHDPDAGVTTTVSSEPGPVGAASFRGSSQGLPDGDGWIFVIHEAAGEPRTYAHRLVRLDASLAMTGVSPAFSFTGRRIEFCAGIAAVGDDVVLSFGVHDRSAHLVRVAREALLRLLD